MLPTKVQSVTDGKALPKTLVFDGLKNAPASTVFSDSYKGQCRRVFGGYQESDSLDLRGILPSMEAST